MAMEDIVDNNELEESQALASATFEADRLCSPDDGGACDSDADDEAP
jgi:hypothetical protein